MQRLLIFLILYWPFLAFGDDSSHIGTWELHRFQLDQRAGEKFPIHRIILSADGTYQNSATPGGPIQTKYKVEKDTNNHGQWIFLIQNSEDQTFGQVGFIRVDKRGLTMTYNRNGRTLTYTRLKNFPDPLLLKIIPEKTITIEQKQ